MDEGGLSSSENGFGRFPLLNSQGSWLPVTPVKSVPARRHTVNGDEELPWHSSLGLPLHNADSAEASCSGSATTRYANPIGDLNLPQETYGNDSIAAGGFRSNYHRGNVSFSFTEDLASVLTQITSNSLHSTFPATMHSQNNSGWHQREVQHPIPFTPTSIGNWTWQHSYLPSMSPLTQSSFSTSDAVAPPTPEKAIWKVDIDASTRINLRTTRDSPPDVRKERQQNSLVASSVSLEVGQKEPHIIHQENLEHVEQRQVQKDKWNGYPSQKIQYGFPIHYNKFMCGINPPSNDAALFSTSNAVDALVAPVTPQEFEDNSLKHVTDSQQSETVSLLKEDVGLEKVHADGVDLKRTPSQKPKRRKIRPKVTREDKPNRPSKKEQVEQTPGEAPSERKKRPYRRKAKETPITGPAGCSPNATTIASCKRSLNFEFDAQARQDYAYLQPDPHSPDNQHGAAAENTIESVAFDLNHSINNLSSIHVPLLEDSLPSLLKRKASTMWNPKDMARKKNNLEKRVHKKHQEDLSTTPSKNTSQKMAGSNVAVHNTIYKDEAIVPSECQSSTQTSYPRDVQVNPHGPTELAISPKLTMDMFQAHLYRNSGWSLVDLFDEYKRLKQINDGTYKPDPCHEIFKNQNTETDPQEVQSCKESTSTSQDVCGSDSAAIEGVYRPINTNQLTSQSFNEMLTSQSTREQQEKAIRQNKYANYKTSLEMEQQHSRMKHSYPGEKFSTFQHDQDRNSVLAQMEEKRNRSSSIHPNHIYHPFTLFPETGHNSITEHCVQERLNAHIFQGCQATLPTEGAQKEPKKRGRRKLQTTKNAPSNAIDSQMYHAASITNIISKPKSRAILNRNLQRNLSTKFPSGVMNPIDEIIHSLQNLHIGSKNDECAVATVENVIVPYVADGTIIPYKSTRRKPRPKVDLDEETTRVWKLLMGNESEWIDGTNADTEKWWAEERRVFQGRADSFIARMHLVQGDRRFSQWKGSVVDSVVGVFLTQNVSDHLSSSAFMALAARFPLKEKPESATASNNECIPSATGQVSPAGNLHETTQLTKSPAVMNIVSTSMEFRHSEHKESILPDKINIAESCGNTTTTNEENCIKIIHSNEGKVVQDSANSTSNLQPVTEFDRKLMEPKDGNSVCFSVISSQDSTDSIAQAVDQTGSTADFSKPAEEPINRGRYSNFMQGSFSELLHIAGTPSLFKDFCANESLYLSLGQKISTTSDQLLHGKWETNLNKGSHADSSLEIGNKGNSTDIANDFSAGQSHITTFSLENHTPSFLNKATYLQFKSFQHGNQAVQQANLHSHRKVKDTADANALEHAGSVENHQFLKSKLDAISKDEVISNEKPRRKVFRAKKGEALGTKEKWDPLKREVMEKVGIKERYPDKKDSLDWEAVRHANVDEVAETIKERGMNHMLAARIQEFLNRLVKDHGSTDLEWLRDVPPDKAKDFLLSINGLGLKSVECVRLLTLHHLAFPVDTNVGRICVRLGWVPLQPLPESLQLHLLELYPVLESIQKYLWPRLCKLDQRTLYELHYQLITFGKVFCTKSRPNCNACPMRGECRHFASAFASARLALPGPEEKSLVSSTVPVMAEKEPQENFIHPVPLPPPKELPPAVECSPNQKDHNISKCEPIIEEPKTPEPEYVESSESAIEDFNYDDPDEIPTIKLNLQELTVQVQNYIKDKNMGLQDPDMSKALVALTPEAASIPMPKLKNVSRLRTEHQVYELPDNHPLLNGLDKREPDDPCSYLLAIWTPGETAESVEPPKACCDSEASGNLCDRESCFSCNAIREANAQTVRGTVLIPCRTAMRGSFPLNGTYFQVNEVFADHESSLNPIAVSRALIWNLPRRTVYFGTSVTSIFKGLTTEGIQYCFWRGFLCVRGFDQKTRAPRPLMARLHFPASKQTRDKRKAANI